MARKKQQKSPIVLAQGDIALLRDILTQGYKITEQARQPQAGRWLMVNCLGALTRYETGQKKKEARVARPAKRRLRGVRGKDGRLIARTLDVDPTMIEEESHVER